MVVIAAVREVEGWSAANIVGGLVLLGLAVYVLYRAIRRYLRD